jgi:hypothetical protein
VELGCVDGLQAQLHGAVHCARAQQRRAPQVRELARIAWKKTNRVAVGRESGENDVPFEAFMNG